MQRKTRRVAILVAALASSVAGVALAQDTGDVFDRIDRDGDGAISQEEFRNFMAATYGSKDTDGNRTLTWAELHADTRPKPADWVDFSLDAVMDAIPTAYSQRDKDGDGKLSRDEMAAAPAGALVEQAAEAKAKKPSESDQQPKE